MLFSKDEDLKSSSAYVGFLILKLFKSKKVDKISIFDVSEHLKKYDISHYRQIFFGLSFLYSTGVVDFKEPYIHIIHDKN